MANRKYLAKSVVTEIRSLYNIRRQCVALASELSFRKIGKRCGCSGSTAQRISFGRESPGVDPQARLAIQCFTKAKKELIKNSRDWTLSKLAKRFHLCTATVFSIVSNLSYPEQTDAKPKRAIQGAI